jgi:hypothetical protein
MVLVQPNEGVRGQRSGPRQGTGVSVSRAGDARERPDSGGVAGVAAQRGGEVAAAADPAGAGSPTERSTPMTSDTTGHLDLRLMVVVYDAVRRDLAHLPRAASHRPAELTSWPGAPPPCWPAGSCSRPSCTSTTPLWKHSDTGRTQMARHTTAQPPSPVGSTALEAWCCSRPGPTTSRTGSGWAAPWWRPRSGGKVGRT